MYKNSLVRKIRLISKFMMSQPVNKQLHCTYCPIPQEVRQSDDEIGQLTIFLKNLFS